MLQPIERPVTAGEVHFGLDEIFYSRTDQRGIIRAGNDVFQRVSGFSWEKLIGAPHKIVRHPEMPKAVFKIMWQSIQDGRPIAAYVKNRSENGGYYWVLATILPNEQGYLSVRIKPSTPLFDTARDLYAEVLKAEANQNLPPEKSAELLIARLQDLGFNDYTDFMTQALDQEQNARDQKLERVMTTEMRSLSSISELLRQTLKFQAALLTDFEALQSIPNNMRIIASRLEPSGGPVSAISENYKFISADLYRRLAAFASGKDNLCQTMVRIVSEAIFLTRSARNLSEVVRAEEGSSAKGSESERGYLADLETNYLQRADAALKRAAIVSGELYQSSAEIRRMMLGLDTIRVMGRVESGRLGTVGAGLGATIDQLDLRHGEIAAKLQNLMNISAKIRNGVAGKVVKSAA